MLTLRGEEGRIVSVRIEMKSCKDSRRGTDQPTDLNATLDALSTRAVELAQVKQVCWT
jgi:hypothetical protein